MEKQIETEEPRSRFVLVVTVVLVAAFAAWFTLAMRANNSRTNSGARTSTTTIPRPVQSQAPATVQSGMILEFAERNNHETNRLCRNPGLGDSNTDSLFVVQDVD